MAEITKEEAEALIKVAKEEAEAATTAAQAAAEEKAEAEVATAKGEIKETAEIRKKLEAEYTADKGKSSDALEAVGEANAAILSLGLKFKGAYSASAVYKPGDVVVFESNSYICTAESEEEQPNESDKWFFRGQA